MADNEVEVEVKTYEVIEDSITGAMGRIVTGPRRAIIRLRADAEPDTVDYLLKKAESGENEMPALLARLALKST